MPFRQPLRNTGESESAYRLRVEFARRTHDLTSSNFFSNPSSIPVGNTRSNLYIEEEVLPIQPVDLYIPSRYDVGNVRAICYAIDNGNSSEELFKFLGELSATFIELEGVIKLYAEIYRSLNEKRFNEIKRIFKEYTEKSNLPARRDPCYECKKEFIYWNLIEMSAKPLNSAKNIKIKVCGKCYETLSKNTAVCDRHFGAALLGKINAICPLYPSKCKPKGYCTSPECLHQHLLNKHKGYHQRQWKASKRFLTSKEGKIIKSDLMTGVEFEVFGKNKASLRTNVYKLGKRYGIEHDSSLHDDAGQDLYMATEVITPPASGLKLEDIVYKTGNALVKDGFITNTRCGLHIHIDLFKKYGHININPDFYKSLLAAYVVYEPMFYGLVPTHRSSNSNIRDIQRRYYPSLLDNRYFDTTKFSKIWYQVSDDRSVETRRNQKRHESKYFWASFHSLLRMQGLEIRIMEGSTDATEILWWIRLNHAFIEAIGKDQQFYKRFPQEFNMFNSSNKAGRKMKFLDLIKDPELTAFINKREKMHDNSSSNSNGIQDQQIADVLSSIPRQASITQGWVTS